MSKTYLANDKVICKINGNPISVFTDDLDGSIHFMGKRLSDEISIGPFETKGYIGEYIAYPCPLCEIKILIKFFTESGVYNCDMKPIDPDAILICETCHEVLKMACKCDPIPNSDIVQKFIKYSEA
jgi:hypothetical protein